MSINLKNKRSTEFSAASMTDLVFLLLIFFVLVSTLVSPNAIKLLLPSSNSKTMAKQTTTVYIDANSNFFVETLPASPENLEAMLEEKLVAETEGVVVIRADKTVPIQAFVNIFDALNSINQKHNTKHKPILAVKPAE
ncbi:biopolymer transporter ExbD [Bacteroidia bacterium]|nr:biopolymer transporter ExbD [Bacteroidia bacterium]